MSTKRELYYIVDALSVCLKPTLYQCRKVAPNSVNAVSGMKADWIPPSFRYTTGLNRVVCKDTQGCCNRTGIYFFQLGVGP
jgi:hypothetical protein